MVVRGVEVSVHCSGFRVLPGGLLCAVVLVMAAASAGRTAELSAEKQPVLSSPLEELRQPGINSFTKGALANVVIRGYQRENLMFSFDGAPYFGSVPFKVDAPPFLVYSGDVGRLVVTKGPYNLALPGSLGGSVEVLSPDYPRRPSARASFSYGGYDLFDGTAVLGYGSPQGDLSVGYRGRSSGIPQAGDGISLVRVPYPQPNNNYRPGVEDSPMYRVDQFVVRAGVNPTESSRIDLSYRFFEAGDIKIPTSNFDLPEARIHLLNGRLTLQRPVEWVRSITLQGWWSRSDSVIDDGLRQTSNPDNLLLPYRSRLSRSYAMTSSFAAQTAGGRLESVLTSGPGSLRTGVDLYRRSWSGRYSALLKVGPTTPFTYYDDQTQIPEVSTLNLGMFLIHETSLAGTLRSVVSLRGDVARVDADGIPSSTADLYRQLYATYYPGQGIPGGRDFADWSANVQLFWQALPELELSLKGGRAVRLPDPHELYTGQRRQGSNLIGNPFMKQTVLHQIDAGAVWTAGRYRAELTAFYGWADNYILPVKRTGGSMDARSADNVDATVWGVEFAAEVQLPAHLKADVMTAYTEGESLSHGRPLAEMPPLRGRLRLRYDDRRFFAGISQMLVARQNRFDPALTETSMPGYGVTDLQFGMRHKGLTLTAALTNLFDIRYVQPLGYQRDPNIIGVRIPESGRSFLLSATYRY